MPRMLSNLKRMDNLCQTAHNIISYNFGRLVLTWQSFLYELAAVYSVRVRVEAEIPTRCCHCNRQQVFNKVWRTMERVKLETLTEPAASVSTEPYSKELHPAGK